MSRQDFLSNLWLAGYRFLIQRIYPLDKTEGIEARSFDDQIANASLWLNPDTLSGFRVEDYPELNEDERRELEGWVRQFREIADSIRPNQPLTVNKIRSAYLSMVYINKLLRSYMPIQNEALKINKALSDIDYPGFVQFLDFNIGADSTGDPAVWIWVVVDDKAAGRKSFAKASSEIRRQIHEAISRAGIERWPYIRYRTLSEHLELSGQAAQ